MLKVSLWEDHCSMAYCDPLSGEKHTTHMNTNMATELQACFVPEYVYVAEK